MNNLHLAESSSRVDLTVEQRVVGTKKRAAITGIFFILATASAIIGGGLYEPLLTTPAYLIDGARLSRQIVTGAVFEMILAIAATGTGVMLFGFLKRYSESLGLAYLVFRLLEVVFILIGIVCVLSLLSLTQLFAGAGATNKAAFDLLGASWKATYKWTFLLGPHFMLGVNTFVYSLVFYKTELVPKRLAALGISGAVMIFIAALLQMFDVIQMRSITHILLAIPVASYEMILAARLIAKGFNDYPAEG